MKRARFSEEQIIGILRENEAGAKAGELARKHGVSEGTIYAWKAKFGGMSVSDAQRLRSLEEENGRLKRLLAEVLLGKAGLNEILAKKREGPPRWAEASAIFERCSRSASGGPARSSGLTVRWCVTGHAVCQIPRCVSACAAWPLSGGGLAIGDCSCCCGRRGNLRERTAFTGC